MAKARKPEAAPEGLPGDAAPQSRARGGVDYQSGRAAIRAALVSMPAAAGVYRMLDRSGEVLYVGKAKNLRNRVQSYFTAAGLSSRILKMVGLTRAVEIVTTRSEVEALLLESNLIKRLKPRYNILLRDDKSFPYILVTGDEAWPQIIKHRGARNRKGAYFGPFASAGAVNRTLNTLQKAFPLRTCSDATFNARSRPCLQYQIRRCTAPCVGYIDGESYKDIVADAADFLAGSSRKVQADLSRRMTAASEAMDFETAALYRDRLRALAHIQSRQGINVSGLSEADVIAVEQQAGQSCIQVFFFRSGQNWGNRAFYPSHGREQSAVEVLTAFIGQFYDDKPPPREVLTNAEVENVALIAEALSLKAGRRVRLHRPRRGARRDLIAHAEANARDALSRRLAESASARKILQDLAQVLALDSRPERIEVYDNSHIQGRDAIGAMIVAGAEGFIKNAYRKFNIKRDDLAPGDDYGMMREVLTRRFTRLLKAERMDGGEAGGEAKAERDNRRVAGVWPDLVMLDGGQGQLNVALEVFEELGVHDVALAAIAKGPERDAGRETIYRPDGTPVQLPPRSPLLYHLQRLRDEAHRFAIGTHRSKRAKGIVRSILDEIPGIGPRRKRILLNHFGSARAVERAALADLAAVDGISQSLARRIHDFLHDD